MTPISEDLEKSIYSVIEMANAIVICLDPSGAISYCNKRAEDLCGREKSQITGKSLVDVFTRQQMLKAVVDDSLTYKRPNNFDGALFDKNNTKHFISWSVSPVDTGDGKLSGALLIGNDISAMQDRAESLKNIDETLKNIFSSISDYALYVINLDGNITYFGMGAENMFRWLKDEIIFKNISFLHGNDEIGQRIQAILGQVNSFGKFETETYFTRKDGSIFPVSLTVNKFLDPEGKMTGYIFMAKDVTERKRLEYQVFQAEKLAAIGQLAAGMAHEINNPLFVISGRLEMALADESMDKKIRGELDIMSAQVERIRRLVDRFLTFARKTPSQTDTLNINEVIDGVLPLLSYHKLPDAKVEIVKEFDPNLSFVKGDLQQLQEVFVNLFINAFQAMPKGGTLYIKTKGNEKFFAEVRVTDTGSGISPQNLKNIFMPFFSTKKDGTGLGLSICYNIIKNHNGSIDIESQLNRGTTFVIKLPVA